MSKKAVLPIICLCFSLLYLCGSTTKKFHTIEEIEFFKSLEGDTLHKGYNGLFAASGDCQKCHGYDSLEIASVAGELGDVNVVDDWKTTMMAMSAKDPFWRAKVSHEVFVNPEHQEEIEDKCTSCHASLGHFAAFHNGAEHYSMEDLENDPWGLDGVSCLSCHQQDSIGLGSNHSGTLFFDTAKVAYGQYISPLTSPMVMETGYWPTYSDHIQDAGICAGCHTLITESIDLEGNFTGNDFIEQATYHEWLNSTYDDQDISCQNCHMPSVGDTPVFLIAGLNTVPRPDFSLHEFAGANTMMLQLMKENKDSLHLAGTDEQFDQTIQATFSALQNESSEITLDNTYRDDQVAEFEVTVNNLTGHKFPSGYPSRRLFLQFIVTDAEGNTIFSSGETGDDYILPDEDDEYEPHYTFIDNPDQVQIYEMVMGDINGNFTTVLDRGYLHLKDNRLLPIGFSLSDPVIDTVLVRGDAQFDENYMTKMAGLGLDELTYSVDLNGYSGELNVELNAFYQSIPHRWLEEIFEVSTPEIETFQEMYNSADKSPVLIDSESLVIESYVGVDEISNIDKVELLYNDQGNPVFYTEKNKQINIFDSNGRLVESSYLRAGYTHFPELSAGIYIAEVIGHSETFKVIVN